MAQSYKSKVQTAGEQSNKPVEYHPVSMKKLAYNMLHQEMMNKFPDHKPTKKIQNRLGALGGKH